MATQQNLGKKLVDEAERWVGGHNCVEMASDAFIDNKVAQRAHEALGYEVVERCVLTERNSEASREPRS